jgi:hypothetical protein
MPQKRSTFDLLITSATLHQLEIHRNSSILDMVIDGDIEGNIPLKNVCAKVAPELSDRIDNVCAILGIRKRRFLEAAFIEACDMAEETIESEGLMDELTADYAANHQEVK